MAKKWILFVPFPTNDLWPNHPVDFKINNLVAPYGQQQKKLGAELPSFQSTILCGNENRWAVEGEKALSWHIQLVDENSNVVDGISINPSSFKHKQIVTITAGIDLLDTHKLCKGCKVYFKFDSTNFEPCDIKMNGVACTTKDGSGFNYCTAEAEASKITITFEDTYVKGGQQTAENPTTSNFITGLKVFGNWGSVDMSNNQNFIYKCPAIDATSKCNIYDSASVTIDPADYRLEVTKVIAEPSNANNDGSAFLSNYQIAFKTGYKATKKDGLCNDYKITLNVPITFNANVDEYL